MGDDDISETTRQVLAELDPGSVIGDKVVLSKAQATAVLVGGATLAGVLGVGAGSARAQSGGKLGAADAPLDADLGNYGSTSTANGWELTVDGDTYQINE